MKKRERHVERDRHEKGETDMKRREIDMRRERQTDRHEKRETWKEREREREKRNKDAHLQQL